VNDLLGILRKHQVNFSCVNRVELDRQHLADVDLVIAVGGDGTVLSAAHFLDNGTIPLLGINSDPMTNPEEHSVNKKSDERRSHGALCMCTSTNMKEGIGSVLHGDAKLALRRRINCVVKSTFSETKLVPALNDLLIANPSPAAVSRFRMGWLEQVGDAENDNNGNSAETILPKPTPYGTLTRFGGIPYDVTRSLNVWSSGMWVSTSTGSTAAMAAAGGFPMDLDSHDIQYLIREHMIEGGTKHMKKEEVDSLNHGFIKNDEKIHLRWNSQHGRIFIDGSHLTHNVELGDEILIDNTAPSLQLFTKHL